MTTSYTSPLPESIDELWERRSELTPDDAEAREIIVGAVDQIDAGKARVAHVDPETDEVVVDQRAKRAILLAFQRAADGQSPRPATSTTTTGSRSRPGWTGCAWCPARSPAGVPTSPRRRC